MRNFPPSASKCENKLCAHSNITVKEQQAKHIFQWRVTLWCIITTSPLLFQLGTFVVCHPSLSFCPFISCSSWKKYWGRTPGWFHILVLLGGLHHDKVPLVVQPFVEVVVMCLWRTWIQWQHGTASRKITSHLFVENQTGVTVRRNSEDTLRRDVRDEVPVKTMTLWALC